MPDVPVIDTAIPWLILPPGATSCWSMFTVVAKFAKEVDPKVFEVYRCRPNGVRERFLGNHCGTVDENGKKFTYIWFNLWAEYQEMLAFEFRITWTRSNRLWGTKQTFHIFAYDYFQDVAYDPEEQNLLSQLEPCYYSPALYGIEQQAVIPPGVEPPFYYSTALSDIEEEPEDLSGSEGGSMLPNQQFYQA
ncbi:hypothetical protein F4808DRAFT_455583 [Astrocystis sublimbata]|nr:hypothetical protein F4808DRAFT_455583 [Astrocystis sublimbata]